VLWRKRNLYEEIWGFIIECSCGGVARVKDSCLLVDSNPKVYVCTECGRERTLSKKDR
jgi:hypothetical protein